MHKWPFSIVTVAGFSLLALGSVALASDDAPLPTNDSWGCAGLIQQGDAIPPVPTNDLSTLKICMSHCDSLYSALGDQGRISDMLRGSNYCRKSLNNLYFSSVAQTITDELNQQTKQQQALEQQTFYDQVAAMIKKHQQSQAADAGVNSYGETPPDSKAHIANPSANSVPAGPPDNVNW